MKNQSIEMKTVMIHELFGFAKPLVGFEQPIQIPAVPSPFVPTILPEYVFDAGMVSRVLRSYSCRENMMFNGEKGTGKSSFVQQFCARLNIPLMTINGGPGLDESYLMGSKTIVDGSVKSVDGVLSYCLRHGITVLIDEIAAIKPSVLLSINDVLNGDEIITLKHHGLDPTMTPDLLANEAGSMSIRRHPRFRLFATDNTGGKASRDPRFAGVYTQNSAVRSRFTCFKSAFMNPNDELKALMGVTQGQLPEAVAKLMIEFAIRIRDSFEQGEMSDTVSFRELKRWSRKALAYGTVNPTTGTIQPEISTSFIDAIYTGMEESDQGTAETFFHTVFGTGLEKTNEYAINSGHYVAQMDTNQFVWN